MMMEVPQSVEVVAEYEVPTVDVFRADAKSGVLVSFDDAQCLMKIAQAEAGNQGIDGMALVMKTVLNRVEDENFPDTVYDVISQKLGKQYQFESYANGTYDSIEPSVECHFALAEIEMGMFSNDTIIAFEIAGNRTLDKYFEYAFTYRDHDFYTWK